MKIMKRRAVLLMGSLCLTVVGWAQTPIEQPRRLDLDQRIEHLLKQRKIEGVCNRLLPRVLVKGEPIETATLAERMAAMNVHGVGIAVIHDGAIEWARGFGVTKIGGTTVTTDSPFYAGSIRKPLSALAILYLAQSGRLDLDADVNQYLKKRTIPASEFDRQPKVTLRELLTNTAGLTLVQEALVNVTHEPFSELMQALVFRPIGMVNSKYEQPSPANPSADTELAYPQPAGLWTTPSDLACYAIEIQKSLLGTANHVLSAKMTREMLTPFLDHQGLGPQIGGGEKRPYFGEASGSEGYCCELVAYNDGDGAVVMTNGYANEPLIDQILRTIAYEYGWPDFRPAERDVFAADPKSFDGLVGRYKLVGSRIYTVLREGNQLFLQDDKSRMARLFPIAAREFFTAADDKRIKFLPDIRGEAPEIILHQNGRDDLQGMRLD